MREINFTLKNINGHLDTIEKIVNTQMLPERHNNDSDLAALLPLKTIEDVQEFEAHILIGDIRSRLMSNFLFISLLNKSLLLTYY